MPSLAARFHAEEMMDDFTIVDDRLLRALDELRWVNRALGGYATTRAVLTPFLKAHAHRPLRLLDVGTGVADYPEHLVRWAARHGGDLHITAIDANPATVAHARQTLDARLPPALRARIRVETADALALPYEDDAFDVTLAAMFTHHFAHDGVVTILREMDRTARHGLVVNDLHRHVLAYYGILLPARALPVSPMFRHDAPLSVRRGFRREELAAAAHAAGLPAARLRWHWAFRWSLSTLEAG